MFGLDHGDAHIIRNAGGVVTDDVIRSLVVSQRLLDTREILLVHHTDCGLQKVSEDTFKAEIEAELGIRPWWALENFSDPYSDVRQNIARLRKQPLHQAQAAPAGLRVPHGVRAADRGRHRRQRGDRLTVSDGRR